MTVARAWEGPKAVGSAGMKTAPKVCAPGVRKKRFAAETVTGPPIGVVPSLNCTAPTAVAGVIVAVRVSVLPTTTGEFGCTERVVVVARGPGVNAIPLGRSPTGMGVPAVLDATVIGVTVLLSWLVT